MLPRLAFAIVICMSTFRRSAVSSRSAGCHRPRPAPIRYGRRASRSSPSPRSTAPARSAAASGRLTPRRSPSSPTSADASNLWTISLRRRLAYPAHHQRSAPGLARLVARRQVDRLHERQERQRALGHLPRQPADRRSHQPYRVARFRRRSSRLVARLPPRRLHDQGQNLAEL